MYVIIQSEVNCHTIFPYEYYYLLDTGSIMKIVGEESFIIEPSGILITDTAIYVYDYCNCEWKKHKLIIDNTPVKYTSSVTNNTIEYDGEFIAATKENEMKIEGNNVSFTDKTEIANVNLLSFIYKRDCNYYKRQTTYILQSKSTVISDGFIFDYLLDLGGFTVSVPSIVTLDTEAVYVFKFAKPGYLLSLVLETEQESEGLIINPYTLQSFVTRKGTVGKLDITITQEDELTFRIVAKLIPTFESVSSKFSNGISTYEKNLVIDSFLETVKFAAIPSSFSEIYNLDASFFASVTTLYSCEIVVSSFFENNVNVSKNADYNLLINNVESLPFSTNRYYMSELKGEKLLNIYQYYASDPVINLLLTQNERVNPYTINITRYVVDITNQPDKLYAQKSVLNISASPNNNPLTVLSNKMSYDSSVNDGSCGFSLYTYLNTYLNVLQVYPFEGRYYYLCDSQESNYLSYSSNSNFAQTVIQKIDDGTEFVCIEYNTNIFDINLHYNFNLNINISDYLRDIQFFIIDLSSGTFNPILLEIDPRIHEGVDFVTIYLDHFIYLPGNQRRYAVAFSSASPNLNNPINVNYMDMKAFNYQV